MNDLTWHVNTAFATSGIVERWILRIDHTTGHIELNPEIPQEEAVKLFVELCNEMISHQASLR